MAEMLYSPLINSSKNPPESTKKQFYAKGKQFITLNFTAFYSTVNEIYLGEKNEKVEK